MNTNIRYLIEEILRFNPAEFDDNDIIDQHTIDNFMVKPKSREELENIIILRLKANPTEPNLLDIDVSDINDFFCLFANEDPKGYDTYLVEAGIKVNKIKKLNLSTWTNTSNVYDMSYMFNGCKSLTKLIIPFNTSNVESMSCLFNMCSSLKRLDLSSFDTSNVNNMSQMFLGCKGLKNIDLSNFDTTNVTDMSYMFDGCTSLNELDLSSFDTSNVNNMHGMFMGCTSIKTFDFSNFNISNVKDMSYMFDGCASIETLDLSYFYISLSVDLGLMFRGCTSLKYIDLSNVELIKQSLFPLCDSLETVKLSKNAIKQAFLIYSENFKNIEMA